MHGYVSDGASRIRVLFILAALSVYAALSLQPFLSDVAAEWTISLPVPTSWAIFGVLLLLFDRYLWKLTPIRLLTGISVPDLTGSWKGTLHSSYDDETTHTVAVDITQHWNSISIVFETEESRSVSISASVIDRTAGPTSLSYEYRNEPKRSRAAQSMQIHYGSATLLIRNDGRLEGEYYTGPGRAEHGRFELELQDDNILP